MLYRRGKHLAYIMILPEKAARHPLPPVSRIFLFFAALLMLNLLIKVPCLKTVGSDLSASGLLLSCVPFVGACVFYLLLKYLCGLAHGSLLVPLHWKKHGRAPGRQ